MNADSKFKRWVTLVCVIYLGVNVFLSFYLIRNPVTASTNPILLRYKLYALPGPFFKEENIRSVSLMQVQFKEKDKGWGSWMNPERDNFHAYQNNYWRYDKLKQCDFERHLAHELAVRFVRDSVKNYANTFEFKELDKYLTEQYAPVQTDSIHLLYTIKWIKLAGKQTHIDTAFNLVYKSSLF